VQKEGERTAGSDPKVRYSSGDPITFSDGRTQNTFLSLISLLDYTYVSKLSTICENIENLNRTSGSDPGSIAFLTLDPGCKKIQIRDSESGINYPDHIFEGLVNCLA
jgi:hypothetical protein